MRGNGVDGKDSIHFSTGSDTWGTPDNVFDPLNDEFNFALDLAATAANTKCGTWLGPGSEIGEDSLVANWSALGGPGWCNPPYSRGLQGQFIAKAARERKTGFTSVLLLPARPDTVAWHAYVWDKRVHQPREGVEVRFRQGRIKFVGAKHGAPFPSAVIVFRA